MGPATFFCCAITQLYPNSRAVRAAVAKRTAEIGIGLTGGIVLSSGVDLVGVRRIGERTHSSGATRRFPARQAAHEEFAPGAPLPLLWIGTAGGGQARAVGLPPPRHHEREGLRAVGELREPGTECRVRTFFMQKPRLPKAPRTER